jgi:hypothetical protein
MTLGELGMDLYDGIYSPRAADGNIVPTGIRYDPAAMAQLTEPVVARITEPVKDVRDFMEKHGYAPTGWVPALDSDGRISPIYQGPPVLDAVLTELGDDITEPSSEWDAGERIVNVITFEYPRFYVPASGIVESVDGLLVREVTQQYTDPASVDRHGEQEVEYDGRLFSAAGTAGAAAFGTERGAVLAAERWALVGARYANGAPAVYVNVMRAYTYHLRAGDWVLADMSWFPNLDTGRRGMVARCQIIAIRDLDCAWRGVLLELGDTAGEVES